MSDYTAEQRAFLEENYLGVKTRDLAQMFNDRFGTERTRDQIKSYLTNHNLHNGVVCQFPKGHIPANKGKKMNPEVYARIKATMFQKGHRPANYKPIGSERVDKDGYHLVKVAEPNIWRAKHVILWEKYNGPVPKGQKVVFANQNHDDIRIENLLIVSAAQLCVVNKRRMVYPDAELTKASLSLANLLIGISKRKRKGTRK